MFGTHLHLNLIHCLPAFTSNWHPARCRQPRDGPGPRVWGAAYLPALPDGGHTPSPADPGHPGSSMAAANQHGRRPRCGSQLPEPPRADGPGVLGPVTGTGRICLPASAPSPSPGHCPPPSRGCGHSQPRRERGAGQRDRSLAVSVAALTAVGAGVGSLRWGQVRTGPEGCPGWTALTCWTACSLLMRPRGKHPRQTAHERGEARPPI